MTIAEKISYIKGLAEGLALDTETKEGKVLTAIIDLLDDMVDEIDAIDEACAELGEQLDAVDEDLSAIEDDFYADEDDYDEEEDDEYYDDDDVYDMLFAAMQKKYPDYKMFAMRLAEDYLDFAEEYLVSVDAIEWD